MPYRDNPSDADSHASNITEQDAVRMKAFALLNRLGRDDDDDPSSWPEKPVARPQQQQYHDDDDDKRKNQKHDQSRGTAGYGAINHQPAVMANDVYAARNQRSSTNHPAEPLGLTTIMLSCLADACLRSGEYIAKTGYETFYHSRSAAHCEHHHPPEEKVTILPTYYPHRGQTSGES